ncbi:hypothetical protein HDU67_008588 [Dinochytrium kinnereticum]|nr:hypothetical protein HDU67_008588 [Dinochytrium kinnereticum]
MSDPSTTEMRPRGIYFITTMPDPTPWLEAIRRALSQVQLPPHHPPLHLNLYPSNTPTALSILAKESHHPVTPLPLHPAPQEVEVAIIADPPPNLLHTFPNLRLIASLWAGVDKVLADPTLPHHLPLVRMVDPEMTRSMAESCLLHCLWAHRQMHLYGLQQRDRVWKKRPLGGTVFQPLTRERRVGILGLGTLGRAAASVLARQGFDVMGWTRTTRSPLSVTVLTEGGEDSHPSVRDVTSKVAMKEVLVPCLSGEEGFWDVVRGSEILVNLLPLTEETRGVLNRKTFLEMPPGAVLVNLGRGGHVVEGDLVEALEGGRLGHAVLDVFEVEPLPVEHSFWRHPKVTVTPHVSALTNPSTAGPVIAETVRRYCVGDGPLANVVDMRRGY